MAAVRADDLAEVRAQLAAGVNPRVRCDGQLPLHVAAQYGTREVVEALIVGGALDWQVDGAGRTALDAARLGTGEQREAIIELLDRRRIADPVFESAVGAIHAGDVARLESLLEANPDLIRARNLGPQVYRLAPRDDYFRDPKLVWYVANNPTTVELMAPNICAILRSLMQAGIEPSDLDYTLTLVMSSLPAREAGHQGPLMRILLAAGAQPNRETILVTAAHWELDALRILLAGHYALTAPIAAALGDLDALSRLLLKAEPIDVQAAFGLAIINRHLAAAELARAAGADVNAFLPVHAHSTALHQAAVDDRADMIAFLLAHGARADIRDTLWGGTPLDWATFANKPAARAALEAVS